MKTKILGAIALCSIITTAAAVDNSIYIEQTGDNATITMLQDGAGNRIRGIQGVGTGNTTPAKIIGDNIQVDVSQVGSGNILNLGINTSTANGASPTSVTYNVSGGGNTGTINLNNANTGTNASTQLGITQTGGSNITNVSILGSQNSLTANQTGGTAALVSTVNEIGRAHV